MLTHTLGENNKIQVWHHRRQPDKRTLVKHQWEGTRSSSNVDLLRKLWASSSSLDHMCFTCNLRTCTHARTHTHSSHILALNWIYLTRSLLANSFWHTLMFTWPIFIFHILCIFCTDCECMLFKQMFQIDSFLTLIYFCFDLKLIQTCFSTSVLCAAFRES